MILSHYVSPAEPSTWQMETLRKRPKEGSLKYHLKDRTTGRHNLLCFHPETVNQTEALPTQLTQNSQTSVFYVLRPLRQLSHWSSCLSVMTAWSGIYVWKGRNPHRKTRLRKITQKHIKERKEKRQKKKKKRKKTGHNNTHLCPSAGEEERGGSWGSLGSHERDHA